MKSAGGQAHRVLVMAAVAATIQAVIAIVTNSNRVFFGSYGDHTVIGMLEIFFDYASRAWNGEVPYRDYLVEYPILAFVLFLIPRFFATDLGDYRLTFGLMLLIFNAVAVVVVAREVARREGIGKVPSRLLWYTLFFASLCPLLMGPYDLAPMAVGFIGAALWFGERPVAGGIATGLGVLLKIFPGAVVGPALVWELANLRRSRLRGTLAFVATVVAGVGFWVGFAGKGVLESFRYHGGRGLQVESLYAGILLLYGGVTGQTVPWSYDHNAIHITPDWGRTLAQLSVPVQLAAVLLVTWRFRRSGMTEGIRYSAAAVAAFMVTGKVLSPQFLIWLIPFMALIPGATGLRARRMYLMACVATTIIYPLLALRLILDYNNLGAIFLLNYRNLLLLGLVGVLTFGKEDRVQREPQPEPEREPEAAAVRDVPKESAVAAF